ncbi:sigma-70 family RNA polymerase sigma factor [Pseudarthrobacter sp. IC2-21]|jgi:RNA polymerase sigma-70 factor (ECF subfamily)|uniref:RNA polymerase sigma factor n=1 Tax=Pseudarthrobacter sp. IC2-21 TaxID=3092262 RepID=UPI002A69CDA9|nr:sigma-70 family RNA polymerase sigma factor [Pseudarthrobacter sp. IC2-21]
MGDESGVLDEVLWSQVVNGDGDAFGVLFDRHHDRVWRHALKVLSLPHLAEEVTAVVFYEAWRRRANVRMVNDSILPWLLVTTNNILRNHVRQQRRYRYFLSRLPPPTDAADIADDIAEADEFTFKTSALRKAFTQLKPQERDVLTLCIIEGLSSKEAGAALGIADGTVKSRLHRAKSRLGTLYGQVVHEQEPAAQAILGRRTS